MGPGHAEIGLAGDSDLSVKVSADGAAWTEALRVAAASGQVTGAAVQGSPGDVTPGRLARADYAYGPGNLLGPVSQSAGLPTGAVIERGSNAGGAYLRFADGTQICTGLVSVAAGAALAHGWPMAFAAAPQVSLTGTGSAPVIATAANISASGADLHAFDTAGAQIAADLGVMAIGPWV